MTGIPHGSREWFWGRVSGILLLPFGLWFLYFLKCHLESDVDQFDKLFRDWWIVVPLIGALATQALHSYLGMKEIIVDYVHNKILLSISMLLAQIILLGGGTFMIVILLRKVAGL